MDQPAQDLRNLLFIFHAAMAGETDHERLRMR
jgi:hypothetical protein